MMKNVKKPACQTCKWNFGPQGERTGGRICAYTYYGDYIKDIQKEKRDCGGWEISFDEFVKRCERKRKGDVEDFIDYLF